MYKLAYEQETQVQGRSECVGQVRVVRDYGCDVPAVLQTHHERRAGRDKALSAFPQFKDLLSDGEVKILKRVSVEVI